MTTPLLISELAARTGFTPSALRYYERVGLLTATERSPGGYRLYDGAAVTRLRFVDRAKKLGLPLEEIRDLVTVWNGGQCGQVQQSLRTVIMEKARQVQVRIGELDAFAAQLAATLGQLTADAPQGPCGDGCVCTDPAASAGPTPELLELGRRRRGPGSPRRAAPEADAASIGLATVPVTAEACTLDAGDQLARRAAWAELLAQVQARETIDGGLRLRFPRDSTLAGRLAALAVREQECCAFLVFTLHTGESGLSLDVQGSRDAVNQVMGMFVELA
jgi:DNA-binding transcriptional MerR regulator